ncbi:MULTISPECIES: hypothetical protein [Sinorhizobium]|uniref:Uncharacterized protein n=1 Tax=Sinorhizobium americanum TaxID=194963 RepID=A0A2S3YVQ7_9HYPH|nr:MULTISPECIES: hypothetical protein [Sinorhizobium]PDT39782.1 hypothetical protein CO656_19130 [Sinorhizobium sp. FG01]POH35705.1 hypothetical protein ATY31_00255 [Sinorhizobium americanum]
MTTSSDEVKLSAFTFHEKAVHVMVSDQLGALDAIELSGEILVVLTWLGNPDKGLRKPEYILPLSAVRHQDLSADPTAPCRWAINVALPRSLFDGTASRQVRRQFEVRNGPELTLPLKPVRH